MVEVHPSICRFCVAYCGVRVHVDEGRVVKVEGDPDNPLFQGFTCPKGRAGAAQLNDPDRLLTSMKRAPDGGHSPIATSDALDEISTKLKDIIARHGPRSVAIFAGGYFGMYSDMLAVGGAFRRAIGTTMMFDNGSIDQPGKAIAAAAHGKWMAGRPPFEAAEGWMLVGTNPLVSQWGGIPPNNPAMVLKNRLKEGFKLIVIDPRRTDVARSAYIHIQPKPGNDPLIIAAMINVILREGLEDRDFIATETEGFEALRASVAQITPEFAALRADVPPDQIREAARCFAQAKGSCATAGTGPNMAPHGNVLEYLLSCLNTICGRWLRAGDRLPNPHPLQPETVLRAQPLAPLPLIFKQSPLRVRGLYRSAAGNPTAALTEEILTPGPGQVRALITVASNGVLTWPDQKRTLAAFEALELSVAMDVRMSATASVSDYVIGSKLSYETPSTTKAAELINMFWNCGWERPYAMYTPALVKPPEGSDIIDMWELFYELAQRMDLTLIVEGEAMDMVNKPSTDDLIEMQTRNTRVPLETVKANIHGYIYDEDVRVQPRDPDCTFRLNLAHADLLDELSSIADETPDETFPYLMISRRMRNVFNSTGQHLPELAKQKFNPAFLSPDDADREGLKTGDLIRISSEYASIAAIVEVAPDVRTGVISIAHGYGEASIRDDNLLNAGSPTSRLIDSGTNYDRFSGIPRMSAIPTRIERILSN